MQPERWVAVQAVKQVTSLEPREATPYVGEALQRLREEVSSPVLRHSGCNA